MTDEANTVAEPVRADHLTRFSSTRQPARHGTQTGKELKHKVSVDFLRAINADFEQHGVAAIQAMRETNPTGYCNVLVKLLPEEIDLRVDSDDGEGLRDTIEFIQQVLEARRLAEQQTIEVTAETVNADDRPA